MTDDMLTDTDKAEEQLYAAIDMGDMEHGSDDSIYIAVDPSEAHRVETAIGGGKVDPLPMESQKEKNADPSSIRQSMEETSKDTAEREIGSGVQAVTAATTTPNFTQALQSEVPQLAPEAVVLPPNAEISSQSVPPPPSNPAPPLPSGPPSESATPSRSLAERNQDKAAPAILGEFVSLGEMEGRQHLRFASKSPEATPAMEQASKDVAPVEPAPKPTRHAFTPFLSVITGSAAVPPSPSSSSGRRNEPKQKSPPAEPMAAEDERRKKRNRDAVSPSSSVASFQTASSRIDETMTRNKKSRKLADRLHDRPPGEREQIKLAEVSGSKIKEAEQDAAARPERETSESMDMDIDNSESPPGTASPADPKPNGATAFNPNQDDFMALDISDDDEDAFQPLRFAKPDAAGSRGSQAFPDRGPSDKGKAKATGEAMCAECGGIMAHSESCSKSLVCASCKRTGHTSQYCSASWRDYVYHTEEEREAAIDRKATIAAEGGWKYEAVGVLVVDGSVGRCYNCGRTGHWGDDCPEPQWNEQQPPPHTAFGRGNALLGPFKQDELAESDPEFVQSQKLLYETASVRGVNMRPGMMGRERQKQVMRQQANNGYPVAEEEDDWFDKAKRGNNRFPGRGNRLGPPTQPRNQPNGGGRVNIHIRGLAGAGGAGQGSAPNIHAERMSSDPRRNGNSDRRYPPNDRDNAAHSFYSSGQGGGSVAEWETDYRQSDQHFRQAPPPPDYRQGNANGRGGRGGQYGGGRGYANGGQRGGHGGQRQYYGGY